MEEHQLYAKVEEGREAFSPPISDLEELLRSIPDEALRRTMLRSLGEVIGNLETIAYEYRKHLGTTKL
ncbi:hypothetical protein [Leisingera sp.]|uniref:hypothetical protein n=1 Tax=Leisingera sp. TaxID=1879318 RepID=UPI002B277C4F|nr:hypothetical protein [Leisingera sp.]